MWTGECLKLREHQVYVKNTIQFYIQEIGPWSPIDALRYDFLANNGDTLLPDGNRNDVHLICRQQNYSNFADGRIYEVNGEHNPT